MSVKKIVAATGCIMGMAHSRMAAASLKKAAAKEGIELLVEIHDCTGVVDRLTEEQIAEADAIIWAVEVSIQGAERFDGYQILRAVPKDAIRNPLDLITRALAMAQAAE
ncbi:MAG: hypothetical protein LBU38_06910 [Propionibacteriaceae bacterium]|jgi:fructose-specific phosphotransferase system component IIB|nr:hypothetical protein [Propionibacteriaceae bacterium]